MRTQKTIPCNRCDGSGEVENAAYRGQEMRKLRLEAGRSLREVSRRMELSAAYISDLELGRRGWNQRLITDYRKALK